MLPTRNARLILRVKTGRLGQRQRASVVEPLEVVSDQSTDASVGTGIASCNLVWTKYRRVSS